MATTNRTWRGRVFCGVSLDGFIARSDGDIDWLTDPPTDRPHAAIESSAPAMDWESFFPAIDHLVMGRGTYEKVLSFDAWPYGEVRPLVLSTTLPEDAPRIRVVRSLDQAVSLLAEEDAREVYVDGGKVVQEFLRADLIDEVTVAFAPVLIGSGLPLFGALAGDVRLALRGTHVSGGMVHITYDRDRDADPAQS